MDDEKKFRDYFRVRRDLFQTIYRMVGSYNTGLSSTTSVNRSANSSVKTSDSMINKQVNTPKHHQSHALARLT